MTDIEALRYLLESDGSLWIGEDDDGRGTVWLNLNDTFGWAVADCEEIKAEDWPELLRLHRKYGWCGLLYWASKREGYREGGGEFEDIKRAVAFVAQEEACIAFEPDYNKRAYLKWPRRWIF